MKKFLIACLGLVFSFSSSMGSAQESNVSPKRCKGPVAVSKQDLNERIGISLTKLGRRPVDQGYDSLSVALPKSVYEAIQSRVKALEASPLHVVHESFLYFFENFPDVRSQGRALQESVSRMKVALKEEALVNTSFAVSRKVNLGCDDIAALHGFTRNSVRAAIVDFMLNLP